MGGFFWLRPGGVSAHTEGLEIVDGRFRIIPARIPCDDVTAEALPPLPTLYPVAVAPKRAPFPAGALGASWSIAALVKPE